MNIARRVRVVTFLVVAVLLGTPSIGHAQLPNHEILTVPPTIRRMILSAGRYYTTVKLWHGEVKQRTAALVARTEGLTRQREALERKYLGNLTALGNKVPVLSGLSGQCTRSETIELVCDAVEFTRGAGLERIVGTTYLRWRDTVMVSVARARDDALLPLLGVTGGGDGAVNDLMYGPNGLIQSYRAGIKRDPRAAQALAAFSAANASGISMTKQSVDADSLDAWVQTMSDSTASATTPLSMARGLQIQLRARLHEASLLVTSARSEVSSLEAAARNLQRLATDGRLRQRLPSTSVGP